MTWPLAWRVLFRFAFCYVALYATYLLDIFAQDPAILMLGRPAFAPFPQPMLHVVIPWIGAHIVHLAQPITIFSNGSGDTTYDWVLVASDIALAVAATIVWSILDRRRTSYVRLFAWLRLGVRLMLAAELFSYGIDKVFPVQFGSATPSRLLVPIGLLPPMDLLWRLMAASTTYTVFAGSAEVLAGALLLFPRTVTLGAIVAFGCMTNVFVLNVGYDVPVKLLSFHLLAFALLLLVPEFSRLADFFLLQRTVEPARPAALLSDPRRERFVLRAALTIAVLYVASMVIATAVDFRARLIGVDTAAPLFGLWFVREMDVKPGDRPAFAAEGRWEWLAIDSRTSGAIGYADGSVVPVTLVEDASSHYVAFDRRYGGAQLALFAFPTGDAATLVLGGAIDGNPVRLHLRRMPMRLLENRTHLVSEHPNE